MRRIFFCMCNLFVIAVAPGQQKPETDPGFSQYAEKLRQSVIQEIGPLKEYKEPERAYDFRGLSLGMNPDAFKAKLKDLNLRIVKKTGDLLLIKPAAESASVLAVDGNGKKFLASVVAAEFYRDKLLYLVCPITKLPCEPDSR